MSRVEKVLRGRAAAARRRAWLRFMRGEINLRQYEAAVRKSVSS